MGKVTPFLMFDDQLGDALEFYKSTFPGVQVTHVASDGDTVFSAEFEVGGQRFMAFNGGPHFRFSEGVSLYVDCKDQKEVDLYWSKILKAGGKASKCGWITDPYGLSWQIIPRRLPELLSHPDPKKAKAARDAMLKMVKIDVAKLEKAVGSAR